MKTKFLSNFRILVILLITVILVFSFLMAGCKKSDKSISIKETKTLHWLHWTGEATQANIDAVVAAFEKKYGITIEVELRPGSLEGENLVKTRLAADDMPDILTYNSGSLFQQLDIEENFIDLSKESYADRLLDSFKQTVGVGDNRFFAVPWQPISSGGIIYNKKVYDNLGLSVPKTWKDFLSNCEKIKAAGIVPVIASYSDNWTAQLILLADYYNVQAVNPNFAEDYTNNKAKFATTPAALRGFEKTQEIFTKGLINKNPVSTTYEMSQEMLATGKGAHYPMATWVLSSIQEKFPDKVNDLGFFAIPGDSPDKNGATLWMPNIIAIPKSSKKIEAAKLFLEFFVSKEGLEAWMSVTPPDGVFVIKGVTMPDNILPAVKDAKKYIDSGNAVAALEFLSPIKGPSLPQICVAVGTSLSTPKQGAADYDKDVEKQAKQLQIPGW